MQVGVVDDDQGGPVVVEGHLTAGLAGVGEADVEAVAGQPGAQLGGEPGLAGAAGSGEHPQRQPPAAAAPPPQLPQLAGAAGERDDAAVG